SALRFFTGTYATITDDAFGRVVGEVRVGFVLLHSQVVFTVVAVAHVAQADDTGHVLQFAIAVGRAGQAVQRVIGDVQLHDAAADVCQFRGLRTHFHAGFGRRRAGCRVAAAAVDFDQAQAAGTEGFQAFGCAQFRHVDAGFCSCTHDRSTLRHGDGFTVNFQRDQIFGF